MNAKRTLYVALSSLLLVLAAGCDQGGETRAGTATGAKKAAASKATAKAPKTAALPALKAPAMFANIPADTPYVFASFEPMPKAVMDKLFGKLSPLLDGAFAQVEAELAKAPADQTEIKLAKAIVEELKGNLNRAGLEKLGFSTEPRFAIYGIGLLPVMRFQVKDAKALSALIQRVETKSGMKAPKQKLGDQEYWGFVKDGVGVAVALVGNELVVGMYSEAAADKVLPMILGQKKPAKSMADGGALKAAAQKHGLLPYMVGMVDGEAVAALVMGQAKGLHADAFAPLQEQVPPLPPECKAEISGIVAAFPRLVMGYTHLDTTGLDAKYVVELRPDLAKELAALPAPVAGLTTRPVGNPLFAVGAGIDVGKAIAFAKKKVAELQAAPYKCPLLADLNDGAGQMAGALAQAGGLPPFVKNIRGFNVVVEDAKTDGGNINIGPNNMEMLKTIKGWGVVSVKGAPAMIEGVKQFVPQVAALNLKSDGKPVPVPPNLIPPLVTAPYVAMNDKGLAFSVGAGQDAKLAAALKAGSPKEPPLIAFAYDAGRLMKLGMDASKAALADAPAELKAQLEQQFKITEAMVSLIGAISYSVNLQAQGVVIRQHVTLK